MRLIDADAIPWTDLNDNPNSKIRVLITFAEKVNRMPTIEERKTGKWIHHRDLEEEGYCGYECSVCGMGSDVDYSYCMRCGADMRKQP